MVLAQAAAEYVSFSAIMEGLSGLWFTIQNQLSSYDATTYTIVGLALLAVVFFWNRR